MDASARICNQRQLLRPTKFDTLSICQIPIDGRCSEFYNFNVHTFNHITFIDPAESEYLLVNNTGLMTLLKFITFINETIIESLYASHIILILRIETALLICKKNIEIF